MRDYELLQPSEYESPEILDGNGTAQPNGAPVVVGAFVAAAFYLVAGVSVAIGATATWLVGVTKTIVVQE